MKGSKRYGRRSTPEFIEPVLDFSEVTNAKPAEEGEDPEEEDNDAVPRKREVGSELCQYHAVIQTQGCSPVFISYCPCMFCFSEQPQTCSKVLFLANQLSGMQGSS